VKPILPYFRARNFRAKSRRARRLSVKIRKQTPASTVSLPRRLRLQVYLQFETGLTAASHSPNLHRASRPRGNEIFRSPRLEFLASSEPVVHSRVEGKSLNRVAEVFLGLQTVVSPGEGATPTLAVSYFHRMYDGGAPEFDIGSSANSVVLLASADVKGSITTLMPCSTNLPRTAAQSTVWSEPQPIFAFANAQIHSIRRGLALYSTVLARKCGRQPLGTKHARANPRAWTWASPRIHRHLYPLGSLYWVHLFASHRRLAGYALSPKKVQRLAPRNVSKGRVAGPTHPSTKNRCC